MLVTGSIDNLRHGKGMSQVKGPSRDSNQEQKKVGPETELMTSLYHGSEGHLEDRATDRHTYDVP